MTSYFVCHVCRAISTLRNAAGKWVAEIGYSLINTHAAYPLHNTCVNGDRHRGADWVPDQVCGMRENEYNLLTFLA